MTIGLTRRVSPCLSAIICIAGCSTTGNRELPHAQNLPPPDFGPKKRGAELRLTARPVPPPRPDAKPVVVDVPAEVLNTPPQNRLFTSFKPLDKETTAAAVSDLPLRTKPFFTVMESVEADIQPFVPAPRDPVAPPVIQPALPQRYVSVGPEYFGLDSEIAPYVVSRAPIDPNPQKRYVEGKPIGLRPEKIISESGRYSVTTEIVDSTPLPVAPETPPAPQHTTEIAALVPPRPDPQPRKTPTDPAPRSPSRNGPDRLASPPVRDEADVDVEPSEAPPSRPPVWEVADGLSPPVADGPVSSESDALLRVRMSPPERPAIEVASLAPPPMIEDSAFAPSDADPTVGTIDTAANVIEIASRLAPMPRQKPVRFNTGAPAPLPEPDTQPFITTELRPQPPLANDTRSASDCLVNRGSNDRMILVCEGVDVSQSDVFRAVVEGESAFRGLRGFDAPEKVIGDYGFNTDRFLAMSRGPKNARDLAFLRALRKSGKRLRVKGRNFDLYLMKGDFRLATVLVEQTAISENAPAAATQR